MIPDWGTPRSLGFYSITIERPRKKLDFPRCGSAPRKRAMAFLLQSLRGSGLASARTPTLLAIETVFGLGLPVY